MKLHHYFLSVVLFASLCVTQVFAQTGKSLTLNGTDQYMSIPNHEDFNIPLGKSYTISLWVKASRYQEVKNAQRFVAKRDMGTPGVEASGDGASGYELWGAVSDTQFYANNAPGPRSTAHANSMSVFSNQNGSLDTWVHIGIVVDRDGGTNGMMYLYQNGNKVGDSYDSKAQGYKNVNLWYVNNTYDVYVGAGLNSTVQYFLQGEIDNLRFYGKALSESEMQADMTSTVDATTDGLIAAYDFENISGVSVPDISGNGHNGILHNYPVIGGGNCTVANSNIKYDSNFTGRGNLNEPILKATLTMEGGTAVDCTSMIIRTDGTSNTSDVSKIKVYSTENSDAFDVRKVDSYTKLGECDPASGDIECLLTGKLTPGTNYLWVTFDIDGEATEGNAVSASIKSITTSEETYEFPRTASKKREILLTRKLLFAPGDLGSKNYRIPAIVRAHDGSLVTATDKRKANQDDLPADIDILIKRSTDNGKTWSEAMTIAAGTGMYHGYGDAGLVRTQVDGELLCVFVGGTGFFLSTPSSPIRTYVCKSTDNGATWSAPRDITDQLFGSGCTDDIRKNWYGSFCASGAGLLGRDGTIYFVAAVRETSNGSASAVSNYVYYSKDNGETWEVSSCVKPDNGNEAKILELNDGTLLVSIRNQSKGPRYYSTSTDGGKTWSSIGQWSEMVEPGCDGDIIYYTSTKDGYEKNRILHSVPLHASSRENVSVLMSYDEGETWAVQKSICPTGSAYSSLCVLEGGTIGAYVEENYETSDYSMYFMNFSLDWLTDGEDEYHAPGTVEAVDTPTFSVKGGIYDTPQSIVLACATEDAEIYYTLDGTVPTESATLYEEPIEVTSTTTIKAIAIKEGMVASAIASATYTFSPAGKYCYPTGSGDEPKLGDTYVEKITTTGAQTNLDYSATSRTFFTKVPGIVSIKQGNSFELKLKAKSLGDYSTSIVRQDLRYTVAVMFIDWDGDYVFSADEGERIAGKLSSEGLHNVGGNTDVLDITKTIEIPVTAPEGVIRARVYYSNAWDTATGVMTKACGTVSDGVVCDFDIEITKATGLSSTSASGTAIHSYAKEGNIVVEGAPMGSVIKVYNITGQAIAEWTVTESVTTISGLPSESSVYLLKITDGSSTTVRKVIK